MARLVPLSKGLFALVDARDLARVSRYRWHVVRRGQVSHAMRTVKADGRKRTVFMHRWLLDAPAGLEVDHRNGNGLDNRRSNLRLATHAQNAINHRRSSPSKSSRYHGVCWNKARNCWRVVICAGERERERGPAKQIYIGSFRNEVAAARAYDRAALRHHGEFAVTNFPKKDYV